MTKAELQAISKRFIASTKGTWAGGTNGFGVPKIWVRDTKHHTSDLPISLADADFIVNTHQDIPALLAEVERLQVLAKQLDEVVAEVVNPADGIIKVGKYQLAHAKAAHEAYQAQEEHDA